MGRWPPGTELHYPYPPGSLLFGLPRALLGSSPLTDAPLLMTLFTVAIVVAAFAILRPSPHAVIVVGLALFALPTGARYIVGGGTDLPSLGLMFLSLALFARDRTIGAGLSVGLAVCMKHLALPLLLGLVIGEYRRSGRRAAGRLLLASLTPICIAIVPFVAWSPSAFVDDIVRFPLGLSRDPTIAQSPTLGRALAAVAPVPRPMLAAALFLAVVAIITVASLRRSRTAPRGPAAVANTTAIVTGLLVLTATAGRWGYLIYPINLLLWARFAFESSSGRPPANSWLRWLGFAAPGVGDAMVTNADRLGVDLASVHAVVLSHGHWDHTGGLSGLAGRLGMRSTANGTVSGRVSSTHRFEAFATSR